MSEIKKEDILYAIQEIDREGIRSGRHSSTCSSPLTSLFLYRDSLHLYLPPNFQILNIPF
jgi:hypothetical protein